MRQVTSSTLIHELAFTASRSSGPGGQNVNKVNSKVTLRFDVWNSQLLSPEEKEVIARKLHSLINKEGELILVAQDSRSQSENKGLVLAKLDALLVKAFARKKVRRATKPSKGSVRTRISGKRLHGEKKKWRQRPDEG